MKTNVTVLVFVSACLVSGCGQEGIPVEEDTITRIEIRDFNWEKMLTTTYIIQQDSISVADNNDPTFGEKISLSEEQKENLKQVLRNIKRVYPGSYNDENVADGVNIQFDFFLKDGAKATTSLRNIRVESYAKLTQFVSTLVQREIQYHQYSMKSI